MFGPCRDNAMAGMMGPWIFARVVGERPMSGHNWLVDDVLDPSLAQAARNLRRHCRCMQPIAPPLCPSAPPHRQREGQRPKVGTCDARPAAYSPAITFFFRYLSCLGLCWR